jgi:DNA-binding transcriptional LysR family regulator
MQIECLAYFYKVAMSKSISKVAQSSHLSQSALSQQLQKLEEEIGYKLLIRSNKGVELTEAGVIVLKYADHIVSIYNKLNEELTEYSGNNKKLSLESTWPIAIYALPCTLYEMKKKFPNHNYELKSINTNKIETDIVNGLADAGFIFGNPKDLEIENIEIGTEKLVLTSNFSYDIPDSISLSDIFKYPIISLNDGLEIPNLLEKMMRSHNKQFSDLKIVYEVDSAESVKSSLHESHGLAFLPYISIKKELYRKQFKVVTINDFDIEFPVNLIFIKNNESEVLKDFIQEFKRRGSQSFC